MLFPGNNGLTDIDGFCDINGKHFFLEWKTGGGVADKQYKALQSLAKNALVIVAWGDPKTMSPNQFWVINQNGERQEYSGLNVSVKFDRVVCEWAYDPAP